MIAARVKVLLKAGKDGLAVMMDPGRLAMKKFGRAHDFPAKRLPYGLMSKSNPENRKPSIEMPNHIERYAGILRAAGTRRDHNSLGPENRFDFTHRSFVVTTHFNPGTQLAQVLNEVI